MKKDLLVCIAFHYLEQRIEYLSELIHNFLGNYYISKSDYLAANNNSNVDIIIDTNGNTFCDFEYNIKVYSHKNLSHPFHLTWKHRQHMIDNIDNYENFMYIEDDMYLPYDNYLNYLANFTILFLNYVPSFVRIEEANGEQYITDATRQQELNVVEIEGKQFTSLKTPYHAFWIMPAKELKETMTRDFNRLSDSRETAASYPMWELNKTPLVEIENGLISKKCYSYHLPNNYAQSKESKCAKIKPENIFI